MEKVLVKQIYRESGSYIGGKVKLSGWVKKNKGIQKILDL